MHAQNNTANDSASTNSILLANPGFWRTVFSPYVILLWALPLSVVIAGIITVVIAFTYADSRVADDYYRDGLAINSLRASDQRAALWGLSAQLNRNDELHWQISVSNLPPSYAGTSASTPLLLRLSHPTMAEKDQRLELFIDGKGVAVLPEALTDIASQYQWYWSLEDPKQQWRLRAQGPLASNFMLLPDAQNKTVSAGPASAK